MLVLRAWTWLVLLSILVVAACGGAGDGGGASTTDAGPPVDDGAPCPAGSMRAGADAACVEGPWSACADGFARATSGWGCVDVAPEAACKGATRDAVGAAECVRVGDCDAPFPPANATFFVDAAAQVDATHHRSIGAALAVAPAGAVIAIEAGDYGESLEIGKSITLVGRCAAKVALVGGPTRARGVRAAAGEVKVSGITVRAQFIGVSVAAGARLMIEDAVLEDNEMVGVAASERGGRIQLTRVVVRKTRDGADGEGGWGLNAQDGAEVEIVDSAFVANRSSGIRLSSGAHAVIHGVLVRDTARNGAFDFGRGLTVINGAKAEVSRSVFVSNTEIGIVAGQKGVATLTDVVVRATRTNGAGGFGRAVNVFGGATIEGLRVHLAGNRDATVMVAEAGSSATLRQSTIVDTALDGTGHVGRGVTVQEGARLDLEESAIVGSHEVGLAVFSKGTRAEVRRSILIGTKPNLGPAFGHGAMVTDEGMLDLEDVEIAGNVGFGLAVGPASARLVRARVRANAVGLYVEDGTALREIGAGAEDEPSAREVLVTSDTALDGNTTRVSTGVLPLPQPLGVQ